MVNNRYFVVTNRGYIMTDDKHMVNVDFTIDEMIANPSVLDDPNDSDRRKHWIACVTKNGKDYWDFEKGYVNGK